MASLYMLPFDHRASFEHGLFGWSGELSAEQQNQIVAAKRVIYDALLSAIEEGVPQHAAALLVDEQFGREILVDARERGLVTALTVELSGQAEFDFQYGEDFARHIEAIDPTYAKVLVRYNPYGDAALNRRQAERLRRLSEYLHRTQRRFLFELLVPPEPAQQGADYDVRLRPALTQVAIRELQDAGVEPDVWKLEGYDRVEDAVAVAEIAQRDGRRDVRGIVLGRHVDDTRVRRWLGVAASVPAFIGFAVGRTTFWDPLRDLIAGRIGRPDAVAAIARNYRSWIEIWETTRREPVEIYRDDAALVRAEADRVVTLVRAAILAHGRCALALSGGATPRPLYELLATPEYASAIDWMRVHVFWCDERCVPPDHPESNFRMTREALLDRVPIPWGHVHRIAGEDPPEVAARAYEDTLRAYFGAPEGPPERSFDLVLLGMGDDGHTASLFPGTPAVTEDRSWVVANHVMEPREMWRITLTPVVLNAAAVVTFLVAGAGKAERLHEVLEGPSPSPPLPVQRIHPTHGALTWMIDAAAARRLRSAP